MSDVISGIPPVLDPYTGKPFDMPAVLEWDDFLATLTGGENVWKEDQHIILIGKNGCGKTVLAAELMKLRTYVIATITKPRDRSLDAMARDYKVMRKWEDLPVTGRKGVPRRMLWPPIEDLNKDLEWQRFHIESMLDDCFPQGGWNIYFDEVRYITQELGLRRKVVTYLLQYRAMMGSVVAATQRPSWIPREFYSQSTHLFFWKQQDPKDLDAIAGIGAVNPVMVRHLVARLPPFHFLYLHEPTGVMYISKAPDPGH